MDNNIETLKRRIWDELAIIFDNKVKIVKFSNKFFLNKDIPRVFYEDKVVLPDLIITKYLTENVKNIEIERFIYNSILSAIGLNLKLGEIFSKKLSDSFCCIKYKSSESISNQLEEAYFFNKFNNEFSINEDLNLKNEKVREFVYQMFYKISYWSKDESAHKAEINEFLSNVNKND